MEKLHIIKIVFLVVPCLAHIGMHLESKPIKGNMATSKSKLSKVILFHFMFNGFIMLIFQKSYIEAVWGGEGGKVDGITFLQATGSKKLCYPKSMIYTQA